MAPSEDSRSSGIEVTEIAATLSAQLATTIYPSFIRVAKVLLSPDDSGSSSPTTLILSTTSPPGSSSLQKTSSPIGLDLEAFWSGENCSDLSDDTKRELFWQYHRSMGCHQCAASFATVLKDLCDKNVPLRHKGLPVVDVLVLNTLQCNVSDILSDPTKVLMSHDPSTNLTVPVIATHEKMVHLYDLGEAQCLRLGLHRPEKESGVMKQMKQVQPEAYRGTVPHWWIAVVVEAPGTGGNTKDYTMVHLDLCGAAYDRAALVKVPDTSDDEEHLVSLKVFTTPEYQMIPASAATFDDKVNLRHKMVLTPSLSNRARAGDEGSLAVKAIVLQPKSNRYFHCYHGQKASVEATPLATFVERWKFDRKEERTMVEELAQSIHSKYMKVLNVGTNVVVCNIKSKPELNGKKGIVKGKAADHGSANNSSSNERVPVLVAGTKNPILLKPTCIALPPQTQAQYRTLDELKQLVENEREDEEKKAGEQPPDDAPLTKKQQKQISKKLKEPAVNKVMTAIRSMQMSFTMYQDPEFKSGVKELLKPPLNSLLPPELREKMRKALDLANNPKGMEAIQLINLLKAAKQRMMVDHPECILPNGAVMVQPGSDMSRVQTSVVKKIRSDDELNHVFQKLEQLGLYINPAK